jgi:triose/dihydroxyacetone kinase / FAD-AMP lyase (cyclizing)
MLMQNLGRHFINDATHLVQSSIRSLSAISPSLAVDEQEKIVYRQWNSSEECSTVSLISGGGAGHEPSFSGFVGRGLLTAAVSGTIFASPSTKQVLKAISSRVPKDKGILVIVMNYTGDVLNFGLAVEKARAAGVNVKMLVVGDDVGVGRCRGGKVGRRGIAGTVLVQKIAGAIAQSGADLDEVYSIAELISNSIVSIGASMAHVHVPGRGDMEEELKCGEVEIGMGIHNEPGAERQSMSLPELVRRMLANLLNVEDQDRAYLTITDQDIVLLINNLGGVSVLEMGGIVTEVVEQLQVNWKIRPVRVISGALMTSLNGLGFSVTLLRLSDAKTSSGLTILELLDAVSDAPGWPNTISGQKNSKDVLDASTEDSSVDQVAMKSNFTSE